jgi:hypothetical protein
VAQPRFGPAVGLGEAYLLYKPLPMSPLRLQARAGLLYVPVSLEHNATPGEAWIVRNTITPSAINSWIGEEVKVLGVEGRISRSFDVLAIDATLGVFGGNDTSGTLLALRGWSFSNLVGTENARLPLPPFSDYVEPLQSRRTRPVISLDDRVGAYAKAEISLPSGARAAITYYNNNAALGAGHDGQ